MKVSSRFALGFLALGALVGCGGGDDGTGSSLPQAVQRLDRGVRVNLRLIQPAHAGYLTQLSEEERQEAARNGFTLEPDRVVSPLMPARGYYLKIGNKMLPGGRSGEFFVPNGTDIPARVGVFKQLTDAEPMGTVDIASALRPGNEPLQAVTLDIRGRRLGSAQEMDSGAEATVTAPRTRGTATKACCTNKKTGRAIDDGCPRRDFEVSSNAIAVSACYDYDLDKGRITDDDAGGDDGEGGGEEEGGSGTSGFCLSKRLAEFIGTPCWEWTVGVRGAACLNEQAIWQFDGPGCWFNHRYRFCQNMNNDDFSVSSTGTLTVTVGRELRLTVRNNTSSNETQLSKTGNANGVIQPGDGIGEDMIKHYDEYEDTVLAAQRSHKTERALVYKAPDALPAGVTEATDTLTFTASGNTKTVTIRVVQGCQDAQGRSVPCK